MSNHPRNLRRVLLLGALTTSITAFVSSEEGNPVTRGLGSATAGVIAVVGGAALAVGLDAKNKKATSFAIAVLPICILGGKAAGETAQWISAHEFNGVKQTALIESAVKTAGVNVIEVRGSSEKDLDLKETVINPSEGPKLVLVKKEVKKLPAEGFVVSLNDKDYANVDGYKGSATPVGYYVAEVGFSQDKSGKFVAQLHPVPAPSKIRDAFSQAGLDIKPGPNGLERTK